jgi:hypothetical protein
MTKKQFKKKFPNGLTNWIETHHEVVAYITSQQMTDNGKPTTIKEIEQTRGTGGLYELAEKWTDEFETIHKGREWDGEFFDEIETFCVARTLDYLDEKAYLEDKAQ